MSELEKLLPDDPQPNEALKRNPKKIGVILMGVVLGVIAIGIVVIAVWRP